MDKKYTYEDFLEIIGTLRSENGCPWDREQSHESLRTCLMEEAAEVLAAIRILKETGDAENLQEELGDVLLQVVMHAQIAKEEGLFTMEDVVDGVAAKMIRRHPHVFGTVEVENADEVLKNWDEIKKKEKEGKSRKESPLKEIPKELPALARAPKVLKKADKFYGHHSSLEEDLTCLSESMNSLETACREEDKTSLEAEMGKILMSLSAIASKKKLSMEQLLADRIEDFIKEYEV